MSVPGFRGQIRRIFDDTLKNLAFFLGLMENKWKAVSTSQSKSNVGWGCWVPCCDQVVLLWDHCNYLGKRWWETEPNHGNGVRKKVERKEFKNNKEGRISTLKSSSSNSKRIIIILCLSSTSHTKLLDTPSTYKSLNLEAAYSTVEQYPVSVWHFSGI